MKYLLSTIIVLFSINLNAQTVSVSPTSVQLWGQIEQTATVSVSYNDIELVGTYTMQPFYDYPDSEGYTTDQSKQYKGYYIGVFYTPLEYQWKGLITEVGAGIWNRRFPTANGSYLYFTAQISWKIAKQISIEYTHFSNGFGLINELNPGLDNIGIAYHF